MFSEDWSKRSPFATGLILTVFNGFLTAIFIFVIQTISASPQPQGGTMRDPVIYGLLATFISFVGCMFLAYIFQSSYSKLERENEALKTKLNVLEATNKLLNTQVMAAGGHWAGVPPLIIPGDNAHE